MTGQGAPDYGEEYVDIDKCGRGGDIDHGLGASEAGEGECLEGQAEIRNKGAGIEPGEKQQIDSDVVGRAHPAIVGPNSHLHNSEEDVAAAMRARQPNRRPHPNCVVIPAKKIWKAMKKASKAVSKKSSKIWCKAKSLFTKSDRRPSDDSRVQTSSDSSVEALPSSHLDSVETIPGATGPVPRNGSSLKTSESGDDSTKRDFTDPFKKADGKLFCHLTEDECIDNQFGHASRSNSPQFSNDNAEASKELSSESRSYSIRDSPMYSEAENGGMGFPDNSRTPSISIDAAESPTADRVKASTSCSSSGTSSGNSSREYTCVDVQSEEREEKIYQTHVLASFDEDDDDDDDIASAYVPRNLRSRRYEFHKMRRGSLARINECEADNIVSRYLSCRSFSHAASSESGSLMTHNSGSSLNLESQTSTDLKETVNNSQRTSESMRRRSTRSWYESRFTDPMDPIRSDGENSKESINREQTIKVDTKRKVPDFLIRPTPLTMVDIPSGEPVAIFRTPIIDWKMFPSDDDDDDDDDSNTPENNTNSWWSGWMQSSKKSSSETSESISEYEATYMFGIRKSPSGESMYKSVQNLLSGGLRSGYEGPVSFIVKKKQKSLSTHTCAASNFGQNLRPKRSLSTCDSAFSPAVRVDGTFERSIAPDAPSTRTIASGSKRSSYHRARSSCASASPPLASTTSESATTHHATFTAGGPSSPTENIDDKHARCSTDGSSDFGEFVSWSELSNSEGKAETNNLSNLPLMREAIGKLAESKALRKMSHLETEEELEKSDLVVVRNRVEQEMPDTSD